MSKILGRDQKHNLKNLFWKVSSVSQTKLEMTRILLRTYTDVITYFSLIDRFPTSIAIDAPLHMHSACKLRHNLRRAWKANFPPTISPSKISNPQKRPFKRVHPGSFRILWYLQVFEIRSQALNCCMTYIIRVFIETHGHKFLEGLAEISIQFRWVVLGN